MDAIYKQFSNPEWWFTSIFIGFMFVVLGAYARDWIDACLSGISSRYKSRSTRLANERQQRIANMLMEPTLLVVAHERVTHQIVAYVCLLALSYVVPAYSVLIVHFPDAEPLAGILPRTRIPYGNVVLSFICFLGALAAQWRVIQSSSECRVARLRVEEITAQRVAKHNAHLATMNAQQVPSSS